MHLLIAGEVLPQSKSRLQDSVKVQELLSLSEEQLYSNPEQARTFALEALENSRNYNLPTLEADALRMAGNTYWVIGVYEISVEYYLQAAKKYEAVGNLLGQGMILNNLGAVYKKLEDFQTAMDYLHVSLSIKQKHYPELSPLTSLHNLGSIHLMLNNTDSALYYFDKVLEDPKAEERISDKAEALEGKGQTLLLTENYKQAQQYLEEALRIRKGLGDDRRLASSFNSLAKAELGKGNWRAAKAGLDSARYHSLKVNAKDILLDVLFNQSRLAEFRGDFRLALSYRSQYDSLKNEVFSQQKTEQMRRQQFLYDIEKAKRENLLLSQERDVQRSELQFQRLLIASVSVLLVVLSMLIWILYKRQSFQRKTYNELADKNYKIEQQKEILEKQATELHQLNRQLQDLNSNLEKRVEERTKVLNMQKEKILHYAFVNSHHLRRPLASIMGLANLLSLTPLSEKERQIMGYLRIATDELEEVVQDINRFLSEEEKK